jgi:hypothetical protein
MVFVAELCPFNLKKVVSVHYLPNSYAHSTQIKDMDMPYKYAGQLRIWSWSMNTFAE